MFNTCISSNILNHRGSKRGREVFPFSIVCGGTLRADPCQHTPTNTCDSPSGQWGNASATPFQT
ncbi:hypothetical protein DPMN_038664 [Dreissena polymorpha]|uniref:Uncharacterized protein n=1 Tax=Dreissena polymorpha TaxID=45954 RepID=A0A9D4RNW0_DREPO|nr:hypothetical protein DPMN_038664 [Dreissena polymorpha]